MLSISLMKKCLFSSSVKYNVSSHLYLQGITCLQKRRWKSAVRQLPSVETSEQLEEKSCLGHLEERGHFGKATPKLDKFISSGNQESRRYCQHLETGLLVWQTNLFCNQNCVNLDLKERSLMGRRRVEEGERIQLGGSSQSKTN